MPSLGRPPAWGRRQHGGGRGRLDRLQLLLQRSEGKGKLAGTGLSFNVGAPLTADFEQELHAYDGLQITHTFRPAGEDQLILESWFNPVGTQAMLMPGWFSDHFNNMRRYIHLSCIGVVVGSQRNGTVKPGFRGRGMKLEYTPTPADLKLMIKGNKLAARIHFASGAMRVMPMTFRSLSYTSPEQVNQLDEVVRDNTDIGLHVASPGRQRRQATTRPRAWSTSASSFAEPTTSTSATPACSRRR